MPNGNEARLYVSIVETDTATAVATLQVDANFLELCCRDVDIQRGYGDADASDRCTGGNRANTPTLRDLTVNTDILKKKIAGALSTVYTNVLAAFEAKDVISVMVLDGPIGTTGSHGTIFSGQVFDFSEDQPLEDVIKNSLVIKNAGDGAYNPVTITMP